MKVYVSTPTMSTCSLQASAAVSTSIAEVVL